MRKLFLLSLIFSILVYGERSEIVILGGIEKGRKNPDGVNIRLHLAFLPGIYFVPGAGIFASSSTTAFSVDMGLQYILPVVFHPYCGMLGSIFFIKDGNIWRYALSPPSTHSFIENSDVTTGIGGYAGMRIGIGSEIVITGEGRYQFIPGRGWKRYYFGGIILVSQW